MSHSVAAIVPETPPPPPAGLTRAFNAVVLAERLLQVHTADPTASLTSLAMPARRQYEDAAAVALALLDPDQQAPAIYAAAHRLVDLGTQTPVQRRGLVQMVTDVVTRYSEALAGRHVAVCAQLAPLVAIDAARAADLPDGAL